MENQGFQNIFVHPYFTPKKIDALHKVKGKELLFVGQLEKNKGCEGLLMAFADIKKKEPSARLTILGSGSQESRLKEISEKSGLDVRFIGKVLNKEVAKYYLSCSVVVVPSVWMENSPVVIYEALSFGKPVVTTDRGGNPELIEHGKNGFVVPANDSTGITKAVLKLLNDDELYAKMAKNALNSSRKFDIEKYIDNLEKIYSGIINP